MRVCGFLSEKLIIELAISLIYNFLPNIYNFNFFLLCS